jgi:hypothetical protein
VIIRRTILTSLVVFAHGAGQITTVPGATSTASSAPKIASPYISVASLPSPVRPCVGAFGTRIQVPGKERTTLDGTYSDKYGNTMAGRLVWQAPGNLRFERSGSLPVLVYSAASGLLNTPSITAPDANFLESLLDDSAEAFFYGFGRGYAYRLTGERFRADDGKTPDYKGPWYDVYQVAGIPKSQPIAKQRWKTYLFDSTTKLLARTQYIDSAGVQITTQFNKWSISSGQAYPGEIVRLENGVAVSSFTITGVTIGPAANDGLFSQAK